jgi:hypothetical protein
MIMVLGYLCGKPQETMETLTCQYFCMIIFEFIRHFYFQNDVFQFLKVFSDIGFRVNLEERLENFEVFFILQIRNRDAKKIPKTVLKYRLKTKETTYTLFFAKRLVVSFRSHLIRAISVLLEDPLRIISGTRRAGKNPKTDSDSAHQNQQRIPDRSNFMIDIENFMFFSKITINLINQYWSIFNFSTKSKTINNHIIIFIYFPFTQNVTIN